MAHFGASVAALALSPIPEQPARGEEGYGEFHQERLAMDTGGNFVPSSGPMPSGRQPNWLLWGGVALGAWFLLKRK